MKFSGKNSKYEGNAMETTERRPFAKQLRTFCFCPLLFFI